MNYIYKDNSKKGEFTHVPSTRMNKYNTDDEMIGAGAALIIGGLIGAAAVAAAADDDYNARRAAEIRREAERRKAERDAVRRADEIRREAARRAAYGMTSDEVVHAVVKYCMKERLSDKMVVMTAIVRELEAQGAIIKSAEGCFGELRINGRCVDNTDLRIVLNSVGGIAVYAYDAKLARYSTSSKVFKEYEILVTNEDKYEKLARVMAY